MRRIWLDLYGFIFLRVALLLPTPPTLLFAAASDPTCLLECAPILCDAFVEVASELPETFWPWRTKSGKTEAVPLELAAPLLFDEGNTLDCVLTLNRPPRRLF